jgi:hypothetical protein
LGENLKGRIEHLEDLGIDNRIILMDLKRYVNKVMKLLIPYNWGISRTE